MIRIVEHDVDWANRFMEIGARIEPWLAGVDCRIEHVGSTSVPGLAAKPIIEMPTLAGLGIVWAPTTFVGRPRKIRPSGPIRKW